MKAAVVSASGQEEPIYDNFKEPVAGDEESIVAVSVAALNHLTRSRAAGTHYSVTADFPFIAGVDGIGRLDDGRRVYFMLPRTPFGSMAEYSVVKSSYCVPVPEELGDITAAAIANPGMSSWVALQQRAGMKGGETVLINGATGASGRLAIQIAKHLGAGKVIGTGRNASTLRSLHSLGADATISLLQPPSEFKEELDHHLNGSGIDIVVDYLWGSSAELLLDAVATLGGNRTPTQYIQVGGMSGPTITLPSSVLRSSTIEIKGSGLKSVPIHCFIDAIDNLLRATVNTGFEISTQSIRLADVKEAWSENSSKARTVFTIGEAAGHVQQGAAADPHSASLHAGG
jgi:NADPH:quinone reductase-like Zn-dependent oxidoreductase